MRYFISHDQQSDTLVIITQKVNRGFAFSSFEVQNAFGRCSKVNLLMKFVNILVNDQ